MIRQFYDFDVDSHALVVKEGDAWSWAATPCASTPPPWSTGPR